jgi:hypothetical protein
MAHRALQIPHTLHTATAALSTVPTRQLIVPHRTFDHALPPELEHRRMAFRALVERPSMALRA